MAGRDGIPHQPSTAVQLSTPREHHIKVQKTARYLVLGDLADPREVWFVVHGYGQLASRFLRRFATLQGAGRLIVAPEALNRYYFETAPGVHAHDAGIGGTWMTREDRESEIADYVAYLDQLYQLVVGGIQRVPARVVVLGFSQGAATAARWMAAKKPMVTDLVLWGGSVPSDIPLSRTSFGNARLSLVFGEQDRQTPASWIEDQSRSLSAAGLDHEVVRFAGGHEITEDALRMLAQRPRT